MIKLSTFTLYPGGTLHYSKEIEIVTSMEYSLLSSGFNELLWLGLGCVIVGTMLYIYFD